MADGTYEKLLEASKTGEILTVIYNGGSKPGTKREISPVKVSPDSMYARELSSNKVKQFIIEKLEIVTDNNPAKDYESTPAPVEVTSLIEALTSKRSEIEALGWYFNLSETEASIHEYFKNGKPRRSSIASITKYEINGCTFLSAEDEAVYIRDPKSPEAQEAAKRAIPTLSTRPWHVGGPLGSQAYGHLSRAVEFFLKNVFACKSPHI